MCIYKPIYLYTNTYIHIYSYTLTTSYNRAGMQHGSLKLPAHAVREHSIICIHKAQIRPRTLRDRPITRPPRTPRRRVGVGARALGPSVAVAHALYTGILQPLGPCTDAGLRAVRGRVVKDRDFERPCVVLRCARRQALLQPWHGVVAWDDYRHKRPGRSRRGHRGHTAVRLCQLHRTHTQAQAERASCPRHWLHRKEEEKRHEDRREDAAEATGWRATGQCYGARALGPVRTMIDLVALARVGWGWAMMFLARASWSTMLLLLRCELGDDVAPPASPSPARDALTRVWQCWGQRCCRCSTASTPPPSQLRCSLPQHTSAPRETFDQHGRAQREPKQRAGRKQLLPPPRSPPRSPPRTTGHQRNPSKLSGGGRSGGREGAHTVRVCMCGIHFG